MNKPRLFQYATTLNGRLSNIKRKWIVYIPSATSKSSKANAMTKDNNKSNNNKNHNNNNNDNNNCNNDNNNKIPLYLPLPL